MLSKILLYEKHFFLILQTPPLSVKEYDNNYNKEKSERTPNNKFKNLENLHNYENNDIEKNKEEGNFKTKEQFLEYKEKKFEGID